MQPCILGVKYVEIPPGLGHEDVLRDCSQHRYKEENADEVQNLAPRIKASGCVSAHKDDHADKEVFDYQPNQQRLL